MKHKIITFFCCLILLHLYSPCVSQITITKSDMPVAGDTLRFSSALPSLTIDLTQTGANYNWDFSKLQSIAQHVDTFFAMSALPKSYKLFFSSGSFATHTNVPDSIGPIKLSNVYTIYKLSTTQYGGLGVGEEIDGLPTPIAYDSLDVLYSFPINFNNEDSSNTGYVLSIPTLAYLSEKRKRVNACDGWGTLTTPYGTFNVLRVKSTLTLLDSVYVDALSFGFSFPSRTYQYKWLANGGDEPILEIDAQDILGTAVINQVTYRDSARIRAAGINQIQAIDSFKIFPNPASSKLFFSNAPDNSSPAALRIYSIYGNLVYQQNNFYAANHSIDISNLLAGNYIVELIKNDITLRKKFIVAH